MIYNFNKNLLFENKLVEPYAWDTPIILRSVDCNAKYDENTNTISITIPNGDEFTCAGSSFKWVEGYPQSIGIAYSRCEKALEYLKSDDLIMAIQYIYNMPLSPYFVHLFESDRATLKNFNYVLNKIEDEGEKQKIEQYLNSLIDKGKDEENLRKNNPKMFIFVKTNFENLILYLKSKCEVFFWFYQGLPQVSQLGVFQNGNSI